MGVDTNYLSAKTFEATLNGQTVTVGVYKYMCRYREFCDAQDGWETDKYYKMLKARIAKVERYWMEHKVPDYAIWVGSYGRIENDCVVYKQEHGEFWVDTEACGPDVGMLRKVGRKWAVIPTYKCWDCKDTGFYTGTYMSTSDMLWDNGSVCRCNEAGNDAARQRFAKAQAAKAEKGRKAAEVFANVERAKAAEASLNCSSL